MNLPLRILTVSVTHWKTLTLDNRRQERHKSKLLEIHIPGYQWHLRKIFNRENGNELYKLK